MGWLGQNAEYWIVLELISHLGLRLDGQLLLLQPSIFLMLMVLLFGLFFSVMGLMNGFLLFVLSSVLFDGSLLSLLQFFDSFYLEQLVSVHVYGLTT